MEGNGARGLIDGLPSKVAADVLVAATQGASGGIRKTTEDVWGGLVGDRIREWRQRNLISSLEKTADFLVEKGVRLEDAKALPDGAIYQIFEGASRADEPDLQALWAGLLATEMAGTLREDIRKTVANTISAMSAPDAQLFGCLVRCLELRAQLEADTEVLRAESRAFYETEPSGEDLKRATHEAQRKHETLRGKFSEELKRQLSEIGDLQNERNAFAKASLIRLGLIELKRDIFNRRDVNEFSRFSAREDVRVLAAQLTNGFASVGQSLLSLEAWLRARAGNDETPLIDVSHYGPQINYGLTGFGGLFADAVVVR